VYQFSRSIYRELVPYISEGNERDVLRRRAKLLSAAETTVCRLAADRYYFSRPSRSLFAQTRDLFPLTEQWRVWAVVDRYVSLALDHVDALAAAGITPEGSPLRCHSNTRRGVPCARKALPNSKYCPSHNHLAEDAVPREAAVA
jgi:hypothetical protein